LAAFLLTAATSPVSVAQSGSGTVRGTILDPSGAAVKGATVEIQNPVSQYSRTTETDDQGRFEFVNVPFNNHHTAASASER